MNSGMNSAIWRATHRFGALAIGILLLFAAFELANDSEAGRLSRIGGAGALAVVGVIAVIGSLRSPKPPAETDRPRRRSMS